MPVSMRILHITPFLLLPLLFSNCNSSDEQPIPEEEPAIHLTATEAGTGLPAPEVTISLCRLYLIPYPSVREACSLIDSLGHTNSNGYFRWENPDTAFLDGNYALSFSGNGYHAGPYVKLADSLHLPASLNGEVYPDGFFRFHITYDGVEVNEGVFHIFDASPNYFGYVDMYNSSIYNLNLSCPLDTTVMLAMKGHTSYSLHFAAYDGSDLTYFFPYAPFWEEARALFCPARDTLSVDVAF